MIINFFVIESKSALAMLITPARMITPEKKTVYTTHSTRHKLQKLGKKNQTQLGLIHVKYSI